MVLQQQLKIFDKEVLQQKAFFDLPHYTLLKVLLAQLG